MPRIVNALLICGLSYDGSVNPALFTDGPLDVTTITGLSPLTTSTVLVQRMATAGISGATARISDLRDPLISSTAPSAKLEDDSSGTLSRFFAPDPGYENTQRWTILDQTFITKATTSIKLVGRPAPTVNQIVYLGNEAMQITAVSSTRHTHTCTVTRGVAGSRTVVHSLDPSTYPPGDDGSREALIVYSRRVYDPTRQIECALYRFKMSESNPHAIESVLWAWYGYLADVPKCDTENKWSIGVKHFTQALSDWEVKASEPLDLSYCVQITDFTANVIAPSLSSDYYGVGPCEVVFRFTPYEFERLFNTPARAAQSSVFGSASILNTIQGLLTQDSRVGIDLVGEVGGYSWVWRATSIVTADAHKKVIRVNATLTGVEKGAQTGDSPVQYPAYGDITQAKSDNLNAGWTGQETSVIAGSSNTPHLVRTEQGETAPKVYARLRLSPMCFADAALTIMLSGFGDGSNDADYDLIPGFRGLNFNPSWVNVGTATGDPLTVDTGTQEWLQHKELDDEVYNYAFAPGTKIGDWFRNELLLRNMILAFVPSTGKIAPRIWVRSDTRTALNPVGHPETPIDPNENLKEQRVIFLERGIEPITLDAKFRKPLQDPEARNVDYKSAPTVRIWKDGGKITDEELQTGNLALFLRACFGVGVGSPRVFAIPTAPDSGLSFGDLVTWSEPFVPTASGLGFTARKLIVLGIDPNPNEQVLYAYCVEDLVNIEQTQSGRDDATTATALGVVGIVEIDTTNRTATIEVDALDYTQGYRVDTSDSGIWNAIKNAGSVIVIRTELDHNPEDLAGERLGYQEIYATVTGVTYNSAARKSYLSVSWTSAMTATRGVSAEDVVSLRSVVQLPDYRQPTAAPSGVLIDPLTAQGYDAGTGSNIAHISAISRRPRFDSTRSILGV